MEAHHVAQGPGMHELYALMNIGIVVLAIVFLGRKSFPVLFKNRSQKTKENLSAKRRSAQQEASSKFANLKFQAASEQRKILTQARDEFANQVKAAREKVENMLKDEKQKLDRLSVELKDEILEKLLGASPAKKVTLEKEF